MNICLEGVPGCGKSDVIKRLRTLLPKVDCREHELISSQKSHLVDHVEMILAYRQACVPGTTTIWERSPLSLSKVYMNRKDITPLQYNLYKQLVDRGVYWKPDLIYYINNQSDSDLAQKYTYVLKHLRDVEVVLIPSHSTIEDISQFVYKDLTCKLAKLADRPQ